MPDLFSSVRFFFSAAIVFLKAARGKVFGNIPMIVAKMNRRPPNIIHPIHHAPNQRISVLSIIGVNVGEM